jgi:CBS domain-containing protein
MFSVYGTTGQTFRGTLEELRTIGPASGLSRTRNIRPTGQDAKDRQPSNFADLMSAPSSEPPTDIAHRAALAAYSEVSKPEIPRQPLTKVDAIMSAKVLTVPDSANVEQAWNVLSEHGIGQAPVVSAEGVLVGLLSRADLMRPDRLPQPDSHPLVWQALLAQSVMDVMWTPVPSVAADTDIRRVARVLLDTGLPGLPVVDDAGKVVGFVSRSDILRAVVADPPLDLWT